jgi:ribosomal protein L33
MINRSESITELTKALIQFHTKVGKIRKDAKNPFFKSSYASLENILDGVTPVLCECKLNVMQFPTGENELITLLSHESGEFVQSSYTMKPVKNDPQAIGSAITYQRRYAIGSILNLNIGDDDDGQNASKPAPQKKVDETRQRLIIALNEANSPERLIELKQYCKDAELLAIHAKREEEIYNA